MWEDSFLMLILKPMLRGKAALQTNNGFFSNFFISQVKGFGLIKFRVYSARILIMLLLRTSECLFI